MPNSPRKRYVLIKFVLIITPEYQHWRKVHRKPVEEHEKEARANIAVDSFLWAREGEHKDTVVHQCQLLDRIAEKGQVWIKWTSTGKIGCIPKSNIEEPTTQS
jgi:hypothetical protein